ncbi:hypothetical protein [Mycoplasmopsis primatum]|uniref:hypothetical protein n=1 Tax=Mycoplasmopsis primatum TaxID=55604 RepID=UPI0004972512|nr:hypothetical protein [Mycoplasmopsis primatum]
MSNIDCAIKILNYVSSDSYRISNIDKKKETINKFLSINDNNKPNSFRYLNEVKISSYFEKLNQILKKIFQNCYVMRKLH